MHETNLILNHKKFIYGIRIGFLQGTAGHYIFEESSAFIIRVLAGFELRKTHKQTFKSKIKSGYTLEILFIFLYFVSVPYKF